MDKLNSVLLNVLESNHHNMAIDTENKSINYDELNTLVSNIANTLMNESQNNNFNKILLFGYRSVETYASILASVLSHITFIPLNPYFPDEKIINIINNSQATHMILLEECADRYNDIYEKIKNINVFTLNKLENINIANHKIIEINHSFNVKKLDFNKSLPDNPVYTIFTSGTTGDPKGVVVTRENIYNYIIRHNELFNLTNNDIFSQMSDISFDLSMLDIFCSFGSGAGLCVIPKKFLVNPVKYIIKKNVTIFVSVPSIISLLAQMRVLKEGILPNLRLCLFCGEAFPTESAIILQNAANNSKIYNLYGPTEATVSFTEYEFDINNPLDLNGFLSIGKPYPGLYIKLIDENNNNSDEGEILLGGDQVSLGYLNDTEKTNEKFIKDENNIRWYKTGDIGRYTEVNGTKNLFFIGRVDDQIKINGFRVELLEIDNVLKEITKLPAVSVLIKDNNLFKIYGVIETSSNIDKQNIINQCKEKLNPYAVPYDIFTLDKFIKNSNGKIDRKAISKILEHK